MERPDIKYFILKHKGLFWYIPEEKKLEISEDLLVETILNYGNFEDISELFKLLGEEEVARIFYNATGRKKLNYLPEIYNFFDLYFKKYAS